MPTDTNSIRLGLLLGPHSLQRWEVDAIRLALAVPGVQLVAVITDGSVPGHLHQTPFSERLFHRYARSIRATALENAAFDPPSSAIHIDLGSIADHGSSKRERLAKLELDVLIALGAGGTPDHVKHAAMYGTWRFRSEDGPCPDEILPGLRESVLGIPVSGFELINEATSTVVRSGHFAVTGRRAGAVVNGVLTYAAEWPAFALGEIVRSGAPMERTADTDIEPIPTPRNLTMMGHHLSALFGGPGSGHGNVDDGDWNIGILHQPIHTLLDVEGSANVRWLPSPSNGKSRSEPFGYLAGDGEMNVLYRKSVNATGVGVIARLRPKPDNVLKRSRTMLALTDDDGYPYVVEIDGVVHMIRTALEEDRTEIHQLTGNNDGFELRAVLLDHALHSPTLFPYDGRWWLMGTRDAMKNECLSVHYSDDPLGPYTAHAMDPVKIDVRSARPAGTPFVHDGVLWRPALDASMPNRPAVVLNKVVALTPHTFLEEPGRRIDGFEASSYGKGLRTICAMGDITLVDGLRSPVLSAAKANASRSGKRRSSKRKPK